MNAIFFPQPGTSPPATFDAYGVAETEEVIACLVGDTTGLQVGTTLRQPRENTAVGLDPFWVVHFEEVPSDTYTLFLIGLPGVILNTVEDLGITAARVHHLDIKITYPLGTDKPCGGAGTIIVATGTANPTGALSGTLANGTNSYTGTPLPWSGSHWNLQFRGVAVGTGYKLTVNVVGNTSQSEGGIEVVNCMTG
jgi:hypothetical protein